MLQPFQMTNFKAHPSLPCPLGEFFRRTDLLHPACTESLEFRARTHACASQSSELEAEVLDLKHGSRILGHSSNPVCGFSAIEQVRLCAVWPMENWIGSSLNQIQGCTTVGESYSRVLEPGPLVRSCNLGSA